MNFLAHAFLAGDNDALRVGGLLGDFVKGFLPAGLPPELAAGVSLHRAIDSFADGHPAFAASWARISPLRRRVGGVLVDLFYDHLLAREWARWGDGTLEDFCAQIYRATQGYALSFPAKAHDVANRMRENDWLVSYRNIADVGLAIDRMAIYRLRQPNTLTGGIDEFLASAYGFRADFDAFLPDALAFAAKWREDRDLGSRTRC